ncbi:SIALI-17 repeat-containing surface protein, partial [Streptococcus sp. SM5]|uniref:SIALI-17 repeat-containing surface protein n=1 Tax=Streptococcus sp. SM5 TaxID=2898232 RepID=UPI0022B7866D
LSTVGDQAAPTVEKPEFQGGVNSVMALKHELPEYTGPLSTVGNQPAPTVEKPEFKLSSLEKSQTPEAPVQVAKEDKRLPETGEKQSETAIFLAGVTLALSAALLTAERKED